MFVSFSFFPVDILGIIRSYNILLFLNIIIGLRIFLNSLNFHIYMGTHGGVDFAIFLFEGIQFLRMVFRYILQILITESSKYFHHILGELGALCFFSKSGHINTDISLLSKSFINGHAIIFCIKIIDFLQNILKTFHFRIF